MKERDGRSSKRAESFEVEQKRLKKQAKEDVVKIRPILETDPDWAIASGNQETVTLEDENRERRAITRLTKKAVNLLYPEYKALSCYGRGTAYYWVHVNILIPKKPEYIEQLEIKDRVKRMLLETGLKYGSYYTDYGPNNDYAPCLHVGINDLSYGH